MLCVIMTTVNDPVA